MNNVDSYKCPNCYNRVYKEQIICTNCGLQLRKGVDKSLLQAVIHYGLYIGVGFIVFVVIAGIVTSILS